MSNGPGRDAATFVALGGLLTLGGGLLALCAMVLPNLFGVLAVGFGFFLFGSVHYLLWGWWFPRGPRSGD